MPAPTAPLPAFVRARGGVRLAVEAGEGGSFVRTAAESAGFRLRFPRQGGGVEAVLINSGGGLAGGDRLGIDVALTAGAAATLTSQAAEKVYRSDGPAAEIAARLDLGPAAALDWLPQETILFDGARLERSLAVVMAPDARLLLAEAVTLGRGARGETVRDGLFRERWRIRRGGRLLFAEEVRLHGAIDALLDRPAVGAGARAFATLLLVAPDAETRLEDVRALLPEAPVEAGASAFEGCLVVRLLSPDPAALRRALVTLASHVRGRALPRAWSC